MGENRIGVWKRKIRKVEEVERRKVGSGSVEEGREIDSG